jgi:hypothetical protein
MQISLLTGNLVSRLICYAIVVCPSASMGWQLVKLGSWLAVVINQTMSARNTWPDCETRSSFLSQCVPSGPREWLLGRRICSAFLNYNPWKLLICVNTQRKRGKQEMLMVERGMQRELRVVGWSFLYMLDGWLVATNIYLFYYY